MVVDLVRVQHLCGRPDVRVVTGDMGLEQHCVEHHRHRHPIRLLPPA